MPTSAEKKKTMTPLKAIRLKCIDCCGGDSAEARKCTVKTCPLYQFKNKDKTDDSGVSD